MAGIDTDLEKSIFEYDGFIRRPVPPPDRPSVPEESPRHVREQALADVLVERGQILESALDTDNLIKDVLALVEEQTRNLDIPIGGPGGDQPGLDYAIRQLGGPEGRIDADTYNLAYNILRNASLAATCVDPVHLVFAENTPAGPGIPRIATRIPENCREAGDPNLFSPERMTTDEVIGFNAAYDQFKQMSLYSTLKLTWYGLMMFVLRPILRMVERIIKALKWTIVLRPIARIFKKVAKWLRELICWSEKKIFGRALSGFCKKGKPDRTLGFEDDVDNTIDDTDRKLCATDHEIDPSVAPVQEPDPADCLEDDSGTDSPTGEGCPALIPPECVEAAQRVLDAVHEWALNNPDSEGAVNPYAILMRPAIEQVLDVQEAGKFVLTSQDNSDLTDKLRQNTAARPRARNRWLHPQVVSFSDRFRPGRTDYSEHPQNPDTPDVTSERCN